MSEFIGNSKIDDEIIFINFLKTVSTAWKIIKKKFFFIAIFSFFSGLFGYYLSDIKYKSELRFIVKNESTGPGLMSGMLGGGGLGALLGAGALGSSLERTVEIASSDRIVGSALLSEIEVDGKKEILANTLIRLDNLHYKWRKDSLLKDVVFLATDSSIENMNLSKRKAIKKLEELLIPKSGKGIVARSFDKKSGVVTLSATHANQDFAITISKAIFYELRKFYVDQMTTSASNNVSILQLKVDSIKSELAKVQANYARTTDQSFGLLLQQDKVDLKKLALKEQILIAMYAEAQKNLETFRFMNESAIPTLTVIDMPYSPLKKVDNAFLFCLLGVFIGAIFSSAFLVIRYFFNS